MPKKPDPGLEGLILDAAYCLWQKGGEAALTMRAVAKAAGTTTPTVYQRFRDKRDMLELLRGRAVQDLLAAITPARSPQEVCSRFLSFAVDNPNLYRLLTADWAVRLGRTDPNPSFELIKKHLADYLGGSPEDHTDLAMALGALVHGTATMLLANGVEQDVSSELRRICAEGCEALIEHAANAATETSGRRSAARR